MSREQPSNQRSSLKSPSSCVRATPVGPAFYGRSVRSWVPAVFIQYEVRYYCCPPFKESGPTRGMRDGNPRGEGCDGATIRPGCHEGHASLAFVSTVTLLCFGEGRSAHTEAGCTGRSDGAASWPDVCTLHPACALQATGVRGRRRVCSEVLSLISNCHQRAGQLSSPMVMATIEQSLDSVTRVLRLV